VREFARRVSRHHAQVAASAGSAVFVIAAAVVGTANLQMPFERGWWLTAYLFLVGGLAQLLLARGQDALTTAPHAPSAAHVWAQWALWNTGTAVVAVAEMAQVMPAVDVGSAAMLIACFCTCSVLAAARRSQTALPPRSRTCTGRS